MIEGTGEEHGVRKGEEAIFEKAATKRTDEENGRLEEKEKGR